MRKMILVLIAGSVMATLMAAWGVSGWPRVVVAKKRALHSVDELLGRMDVQRAEIDTGIQVAKQAAQGIRKARIRAEVNLEQLAEKNTSEQEEISRCDGTLARLRDAIRAGDPTEFAGKTYSQAELKEMATRVIEHRKKREDRVNGFDKARENISQVVAGLIRKEEDVLSRIANLDAANSKLEAEMAAANAMKAAAVAIGNADMPFAVNLDDLEQKIATLAGEIRAELRAESSWSAAENTLSDVSAIISMPAADPLPEIDRILAARK